MLMEQLSVLLLEPSKAQRKIIEGYLHDIGVINVLCESKGQKALLAMARQKPDLVISAMYLPDINGTQVIENMRADVELENIPFILISSETHFRYLDPIRQAGVIAILPKPFEFKQLKSAILSVIEYQEPKLLRTQTVECGELSVLVVDDSRASRQHIKQVLQKLGIHKIEEAENGRAALQKIYTQFFDLIVTDYNMPEMDGKELVENIRNNSDQSSIPILLVTSEKDEQRLAAVQQAGVSALCDKPFDINTVRNYLERLV